MLMIVCDHASNSVPVALDRLGLAAESFEDHIAWDIGARDVAAFLQQRFDAASVFAGYSRLVVDLNRSLADGSAFPAVSDGVLIPGNLGMSGADRIARAAALYDPYHAEIDRLVQSMSSAAHGPVFVAIHSFTPSYCRTKRHWDVGVLWDKDPRLAIPMLEYLRSIDGLVVGDNEPYSGRHPADYSIDYHAEPRGIAHVGIEIRQDLLADRSGRERWGEILGHALERAIRNESILARVGYRRSAA